MAGRILEELPVARHRPDPYDVAVGLDVAEGAVQVVDVDEVLRRGEPELQGEPCGSCANCHSQVHGSNHPSGVKLMR